MGYIEGKTMDWHNYSPPCTKKRDFDDFWDSTIAEAQAIPLLSRREVFQHPVQAADLYEISYCGMDKTRIYGWMLVPAFMKKEKYPCLIHYHGFGGDRGEPHQFMHWVMMGMVVISVDCRDQGGKTGNAASYTHGFVGNVGSKGLYDKREFYYRHVYMDCLKAIDFACAQSEVDNDRIVVEGLSMGGGIAMAVAALDDRPKLAMVDVPSNSNITARIGGNHGMSGVVAYLKKHPEQTDLVLDNLSYFDTMNMADRITCPVLASVGLMDDVCPPLMYFATYNRIASEKQIVIYPFNGHEGGGAKQMEVKLDYLRRNFREWFEK